MANEYPQTGDEVDRPEHTVSRWKAELDLYRRAFKNWTREARRIIKRFELEGDNEGGEWFASPGKHRFNVLFANVSLLAPAIFSAEPVPVVKRRYPDSDITGRVSSEMLQRALLTEIERDDWYAMLSRVNQDSLLGGRGVPWQTFETGEEDARSVTEHVMWQDFAHAPRASWEEVTRNGWVARKVLMTRKEGEARFPGKFDKMKLDVRNEVGEVVEDQDEAMSLGLQGTAEVWEIWDAPTRKAVWYCEKAEELLDEKDDPFGLVGFFPCPMPVYSTTVNGSLMPVPDYRQYESQAQELDSLTERISSLTKELRVRGFYNSSMPRLGQLLESDEENTMIAVEGALEAGGIATEHQLLPGAGCL